MKPNKINALVQNPLFFAGFLTIILLIVSIGEITVDEGMWGYIGKCFITNTKLPFQDITENKTPGIYLLYAIGFLLFNFKSYLFVRMTGIVVSVFSSVMVYKIGSKIHSEKAGVLSMYVFGLAMAWRCVDGPWTGITENFMVLFSSLGFYFIIQQKCFKNLFLSGLMLGFAVSFKQIAIFTIPIIYLYANMDSDLNVKKRIQGIVLVSFGILVGINIINLPLYLKGVSISEYIEGAWLILLDSGSGNSNLGHRLSLMLETFLNHRIVMLYPFLLLVLYRYSTFKKRMCFGLIIWVVFEFMGSNASGYYFGHQLKPFLLPMALMIGIALQDTLDTIEIKKSYLMPLLLLILFFPYYSFIVALKWIAFGENNYTEAINYIKENTSERDLVVPLSVYSPPIVFLSGRDIPDEHISIFHLSKDAVVLEHLNKIKSGKTKVIITEEGETIEDLLKGRYFNIKKEYTERFQNYIKNNFTLELTSNKYCIYMKK
ncbi:MAG: glycosyltransferase family 39 protein [Candidatus Latescibacteria bacterium]|nr:glycosyltransferase family 39 protein [Candidatus Latescibacterota bacterium]